MAGRSEGGVRPQAVAAHPLAPDTDPAPAVGDVWQTSWDDSELGVVLLAAVRPTYVMAWPVTPNFDEALAPAFLVDMSRIGTPARSAVWPAAECGAGLFLLDRRLGRVDAPRFVTEVRAALHGVADLPDGVYAPDSDEPARLAALESVVSTAQRIADTAWPLPIPGEGVLAADIIEASGLTARLLAPLLPGAPPGQVAAIAARQRPLTIDQVEALSRGLGVDPTDLLDVPSMPEIDALDQPVWKSRIRAISAARGAAERVVRNLAVAGALQAARQEGVRRDPRAVEARVEAALRRLEVGIDSGDA